MILFIAQAISLRMASLIMIRLARSVTLVMIWIHDPRELSKSAEADRFLSSSKQREASPDCQS
jgi:hypothetical protein